MTKYFSYKLLNILLFFAFLSVIYLFYFVHTKANLEFIQKDSDFAEVTIQFFDDKLNPIQNLNVRYKDEIYKTNEDGFIFITNVKKGNNEFVLFHNNKEKVVNIDINSDYIEYKVDPKIFDSTPLEQITNFFTSNMLLIFALVIFAAIIIFIALKFIKNNNKLF